MRRTTFIVAGLVLAGMVTAQDLPPDILLLSRVRTHINEELQRQATISCLETVQREHQSAKGKMRPLDTIRLEVLTNGDKEFFASPGDRKFTENHPISYAASGALSTGLFGPYLKDILVSGSVASQYKGEEEIGGRSLARYDYRIPLLISGQMIRTPEGSGKVGLHGSYWVDPQTYDVIRLEMNADDFPPTLPVTEMTTSINYAQTRLRNDLLVLLPEAADFRLVMYSGEINHNKIEFTHCRAFGAESTISFNAPEFAEQARFGAVSIDETLRPLPSGLKIAVKLRTQITDDMAVGTLIEGVVEGNVTVKHTVVIPALSPVRGRIRRLERYTDPFPYFIVGLEFTEVETQGVRHLFFADAVDIDQLPGVEGTLSTKNTMTAPNNNLLFGEMETRQTIEPLSLYNLPGVATLFHKGGKLDLPEDFLTVWKTRRLKP